MRQRKADAVVRHPSARHISDWTTNMPAKGTTVVTKIKRTCAFCGAPFEIYPSQLRWGARKFCTRKCDNLSRIQPLEERFWSKVDRSGGPNACWMWMDHKWGPMRYGGFYVAKHEHVYAHRFVWELTHQAISDGQFVCHVCDTPACVNPAHLFLGSARDNVRDMISKRRNQHGEQHHKARLTEIDVIAIRDIYALGKMNQYELAQRFNVGQRTIGDIVLRKTWTHV